jgi:cystathionine beta-synthase
MKPKAPVVERIDDLIGGTPLVRLHRSLENAPAGRWLRNQGIEGPLKIQSELWAKVEFFNPGGSVKDRIARSIVLSAERQGLLKPGGTIVEATSGNTGAGLAIMAATRGYKLIFVMPDKMSAEKVSALRAYGAKVVITPTTDHENPDYYNHVAKRIAQEIPGAFLANQFFNPDNPRAHYETTGPEIWEQTEGKIDVFVCAIGTGGTLSGTARYLKEKNPRIEIVAVDPEGSIYAGLVNSGQASEAKPYLVEGIGEDIVPGTIDLKLIDTCVTINDVESFAATRLLAQAEGLLVGGSCGSAFYGALQYLAKREKHKKGPCKAVVMLPDSGSRYLSKIFNENWLKDKAVLGPWGEANDLGGEVEYLPSAKKIEGV